MCSLEHTPHLWYRPSAQWYLHLTTMGPRNDRNSPITGRLMWMITGASSRIHANVILETGLSSNQTRAVATPFRNKTKVCLYFRRITLVKSMSKKSVKKMSAEVEGKPIGERYSGKLLIEYLEKMSMWKREGEHYSAENVGINAVRHEKHSKEYCKQYLSEETFPKSIGKTIIPKTCGEGTTYSRGVSEKKLCKKQHRMWYSKSNNIQ